jgi:hypothetical protein
LKQYLETIDKYYLFAFEKVLKDQFLLHVITNAIFEDDISTPVQKLDDLLRFNQINLDVLTETLQWCVLLFDTAWHDNALFSFDPFSLHWYFSVSRLFLLRDRSTWHTCRSGPSPSSVRIRLSPFGAVTEHSPSWSLPLVSLLILENKSLMGYFLGKAEKESKLTTDTCQLS